MKYCIDTSAFIDAWRRYYPPDVFPPLWQRLLDGLIEERRLITSEEVLIELKKKDDELRDWVRKRKTLVVPTDENVQIAVRSILAQFERLVDTRKNRSAADPFVIAVAQLNACAVVTGEGPTGNRSKPNIPDVCDALGIPWMRFLNLIRSEGWVFRC